MKSGSYIADARVHRLGVATRLWTRDAGPDLIGRQSAQERTLPRRVTPPGSGHSLTCLALPGPGPPGEARPGYRTRSAVAADLVRSTLRLMSNGRRYSRRGDNRAHSAT